MGLLTFKTVPRTAKVRRKENKILVGMSKFCGNSIHGINYIWAPGTRPAVRMFWLLIVAAAVAGSITMYITIAYRHREKLLITVVETSRLPVYTISFPAVAVCPMNHVSWIRHKSAEEKFLPNNAGENVKKAFHDLLAVMERLTFTGLDAIEILLRAENIPRSVQNIVLYDLAQYMAIRCNELFLWCVFDETDLDCCKIFVAERTERGICLVFNSLVSEESKMKKVRTQKSYLKQATSLVNPTSPNQKC